MAFSKLTKIIMYVIAGISLVVALFFYVSPKTVNMDELEAREAAALNPVEMMSAPLPEVDTTSSDSTMVNDSTVVEEAPAVVEMPLAPTVVDYSEIFSGWELLVWNRIDIALLWAYILMVMAAIAAIVFPLIAVLGNTRALIRLVAVLAGAAVLVVISYLSSSDTPLQIIGYEGADASDPGTLKMIDTVLFVTYMLFGLALASILYAIVSRVFK